MMMINDVSLTVFDENEAFFQIRIPDLKCLYFLGGKRRSGVSLEPNIPKI